MDRNWMATVAGILNILAGVLALLGALAMVFVGTVTTIVPGMTEAPGDDLPLAITAGVVWGAVGLCLIAAVLAIAGGVAALKRSGWAWPLTGAITALVIALPLGLVALILVVLAEPELRGGQPALPEQRAG